MDWSVTRAAAIVISIALASLGVRAHEFWIEPSKTKVGSGEAVTFRLRVGDGFPGEARPRSPDHLLRFDVVGPDGSRSPVEGLPGEDPAGSARLTLPGIHVVAYRSKTIDIEIEAERFETYLAHVGLDAIKELRAKRGQSARPGRERYSRCAKALLAVGEASGAGYDRPMDLPLELIPEDNPLVLEPGDELSLVALLRGKPLPGLTLLAFEKSSGNVATRVRTDAEGRAVFTFDRAGSWMISGVHMWEAVTPETDWESLWSSLSFTVSEP